jgi:hypothetical protein
MFDSVHDEVESVDEHINHIMFSMCQECRFMAALAVIDTVDMKFVKELLEYAAMRVDEADDSQKLIPEPTHRGGGCYVRI